MDEFDFDKLEVTEENHGEDEFDFSKIFKKGEEPDPDGLLDRPVGDYGEGEDDEGDEEGGAGVRKNPRPKNPSGSHGKRVDEKELAIA